MNRSHSQAKEYRADKVTGTTENIALFEQLQITKIVKKYFENYIVQGKQLAAEFSLGIGIRNKIHVSQGEQTIHRCDAEAYVHKQASGERKTTYKITLIRFADDIWRVFQWKEI